MPNWSAPVNGPVSQRYGVENSNYSAGYHTGIDYAVAAGTGVSAAARGVVVAVQNVPSLSAYGKYVIIKHPNGMFTLYAHLKSTGVKLGDQVNEGERIGLSGNTGNSNGAHLHFEVRETRDYGSDVNPVTMFGGRQRTGDGGGGGGGGGGKITASDFGFLKEFLKKHPSVARLIDKAVNQEWSEARFLAELKQTAWWEKNTASERAWARLVVEDPSEAKRLQELARERIQLLARNMGVNLSRKELDNMALKATRLGLEDFEIQAMVGAKFTMKGKKPITGEASITVDQLRVMADEYGVDIGDKALRKMTTNILQGEMTAQGLEDRFRQKAMQRYPSIRDDLERGYTVREVSEDYLGVASEILGTPTEMMDMSNRRWSAFLTGGEDKKQPMSMDEWASTVKRDKRYGYDTSETGRNDAAALIMQLGQRMGVVG